ncbi:hypothetical protein C7212DRAFT_73246, partial [Tuber magnatum]
WVVTMTLNGWISKKIDLHWLEEIFLLKTACTNPNGQIVHRILVLDRHKSYT